MTSVLNCEQKADAIAGAEGGRSLMAEIRVQYLEGKRAASSAATGDVVWEWKDDEGCWRAFGANTQRELTDARGRLGLRRRRNSG